MSGSLRAGSYNSQLLGEIAKQLDEPIWLDWSNLPFYNTDEEDDENEAVQEFREKVASLDGLIIASPEYNGSIPGGLKNALDWLSRPFPDNAVKNMPTLVFGVSTSMFGAVWAQADIKKSLKLMGAKLLDVPELPIGASGDTLELDPTTWQEITSRIEMMQGVKVG